MQRLLFRSFPFSSCTLAWAVWCGQRIFCPFLLFPALPNIFLPEAEYFWICECLQALCSSTTCASLTSCFRSKWRSSMFDSCCCSLLYAKWWQPQIVEILNWNWVYPLSFSLRLNISGFVSVFKRSAPRLHVLLWLYVSVPSDGLRYLTRDAAPSSASSGRNHKLLKSNSQLELGWYFRHFVSNSFTIQSIHSLLYWKVQHSPKFRIKYHVLK